MDQDNRESWPNRVAAGRAPLFEALDAPLAGAPVCPIAGHGPMQHDPLDEDGDNEPCN